MVKHYPDVDPNPDFSKLEEKILAFWKKEGIFRASVEQRSGKEFIFYDGPPFANGLPHYGHLLTGYVKDAIARYQTMRGKKVERRFGWDCHGLPAEMGSEKELGISGRAAITQFGIGKFNEHCRTSVMKYTKEWEEYVDRQARWVDFKNDYKTMDTSFMESVLWAFKQLYDKGLVYEAYRVMPYSWAAETPLSNFETKLDNSYREREDKAITVAFELNTPPHGAPKADKYYVLAWTTTPWTLPSNLALAVNKEVEYVMFTSPLTGEVGAKAPGGGVACYIMGKNALARYEKELGTPTQPSPVKGEGLVGLSYHPLFPYFASHKHAFKILDGSSFVTDSDGTGIVHMAPGFGEDDQKVCEANGIEIVVPVDGQGKFTDAIYDIPSSCGPRSGSTGSHAAGDPAQSLRDSQDDVLSLKGLNVIAEPGGSKFGLANDRIIDYLKAAGKLIKQEQIKHNYPHCWRTDQPLIYRAMPSWYVEVTKFRDRAVELNQQINWIPEHIRDGQMGHMLATAPDWSISRNRFWGTPIPVWRKKGDSEIRVFGSIAELEEFFDLEACLNTPPNPQSPIPNPHITDLHRPFIDTLTTAKDGSKWQRVEDVFDCWFESGSMPFAQVHYPFENKEWFETHFPADFITEYVGQTRGWFNTLIMLSTALFDCAPFKHCICHGVVLDSETGLKYSKRLKNYKDPMEVFDRFGADALRWMMLSSPVMRGADISVDPDGKFIRDVVRLAIKPIWNAYNFFSMYANADGIAASGQRPAASENVMDRYILAKCSAAVEQIKAALDAYDTPAACEAVSAFFEALNNWYIRRNKERFWKEEKDADKQAAYDTLYMVLAVMCQAAAPLLPLTCEEIYKGLTGERSVHLSSFPDCHAAEWRHPDFANASSGKPDPAMRRDDKDDDELMQQMDWVRDVCNAALAIRNKLNIRVRQPLREIKIISNMNRAVWENDSLQGVIQDEINVKGVAFDISNSFDKYATLKLSINNPVLGKRLPALMKQIIPASKKGEWKQVENGVEICGEKLLPGEYMLQLEPKPEYANRAQALSTNDALVILDTTITPELEAEGLARDLVRMIQQARKDAGLNVADRITLSLKADARLADAIKVHTDEIKKQTLATSLTLGEASGNFVAENTIEDYKVSIALSKAA